MTPGEFHQRHVDRERGMYDQRCLYRERFSEPDVAQEAQPNPTESFPNTGRSSEPKKVLSP